MAIPIAFFGAAGAFIAISNGRVGGAAIALGIGLIGMVSAILLLRKRDRIKVLQPANGSQGDEPQGNGNRARAGAVVSLFVTGAIIYTIYANPFGGGHLAGIGSSSPNQLEKSLVIGQSTHADEQALRDAGGLDNRSNSTWDGYSVHQYAISYDSGGKANGFMLDVWKTSPSGKIASFDNLKSDLANQCGGNWTNAPGMYKAFTGKMLCMIMEKSDGQVEISLVPDQSGAGTP